MEKGRLQALPGSDFWRIWAGSIDVWLRLAGLPVGSELWPGQTNYRRLLEWLFLGGKRDDLRTQCHCLLWVEKGPTWICSLKRKSSSLRVALKASARPSRERVLARAVFPSS